MARPLRLELAGGLYHVTSRGDRREDIYRDDVDRDAWLAVFAQVCERFNWRCHAYCLMSNHYHVVVETPEANLSAGMRQLNGVFTQLFNRRHGLVGHLFQGRFKAILVEQDAYLLELSRYVVLNPVRAGMVAQAGDWPWSSYGAMVGDVLSPGWLETDWILGQFGQGRRWARAGYAAFVSEGVTARRIWDDLRHQVFWGGEAFVAGRAGAVKPGLPLREVPRAQRRPFSPPLAQFEAVHATRREAMVAAYLSGAYTLQQVAAHFGVHYATVSRAVKAHELARG
ncbi:MAG: transposase [Denitromonas halophila]|nr:MAG: transposase [Denitromonas halophila]